MASEQMNSRETLRQRAAEWYTRLREDRSPETIAEFELWRSNPENAAAWKRLSRTDQGVELVKQFGNSELGGSKRLAQYKRRPGFYPYALAAAVLLVAIVVIIVRGNPWGVRDTEAVMLSTNIGEIRQVTLSDGSKVTLDTSTHLEVDLHRSHRSARLKYGRARFEIAAGPEPFTIETSDETITTSEGAVDVEHQGAESRVDVIAGTSQVQAGTQRVTLEPSQGAARNSQAALQTYDISAEPDWTKGMLQFAGTPLSDAVARANRYSDQHIVLEGNIGGLRVSGAFHVGDTAGLARSLSMAFKLSLRQTADGNWRLGARRDPAGTN